MMTVSNSLSAAAIFLVLVGCSSGGGGSPTPHVVAPPPVTGPPTDEVQFTVLTNRTLDADGDQSGLDTYDLIRAFGGTDVPGPIEAPDLYPINHPEVRHIYEDNDATVGNHLVFIIHRDIDIDRDRVENDDRQRNEIKSYDKSEEAVKGYEIETFIYRWKFKINADMEVSTRFSHFFQLKAVGGDASHPILTISGAERSGEDGIEVRQSPLQDHTVLARTDWSMVTGEWLDAYCRVTFADSGDLRLIVTRMRDDAVIFDIDQSGLDLWRGEDASHFVRPKWGIYRSILDLDNLRPDEENVRFANFSVGEVMPIN
ncbi:MAG: heparin lyase I family protein [Woeseiaceae bacterium]